VKGWFLMSEFIRCNSCGDLASFEDITYINNTPLCSSCQDEHVYLLQPDAEEYAK
jgi:formylmethanofuran dehydrogenase subunit E